MNNFSERVQERCSFPNFVLPFIDVILSIDEDSDQLINRKILLVINEDSDQLNVKQACLFFLTKRSELNTKVIEDSYQLDCSRGVFENYCTDYSICKLYSD